MTRPEPPRDGAAEGVLVVDKPGGLTSHDVVARARRLLHTRRVGHAGTLDPMATGVLVVLAGEATKLVPYLTAHAKRYQARVVFGRATDTLDAEGTTTLTAGVPEWLRQEIAAPAGAGAGRLDEAIAAEQARGEQVPPAYSAIHVDGKRSYDLARAGEAVDLAPRAVAVAKLGRLGGGLDPQPHVDLEVEVSKGYYVRSLARDLGERLGVPAHLGALRRTASGPFALSDATLLDAGEDALRGALIPLAQAAARALPVGHLTAPGAARALQGKRLGADDFSALPSVGEASAWLDPGGRLVAVGARLSPGSAAEGAAELVVHRGFAA
jgi:tRNA pseudouridine55 synthase